MAGHCKNGRSGFAYLNIFLLFITITIVPVLAAGHNEPYTEYLLPVNGSQPLGLVVDGAGTVWFADSTHDTLTSFKPSQNSFDAYAIPNNATRCEVWGIEIDKKGIIWFGDAVSNTVWSFDPSTGQFSGHPIPTSDAYPFDLVFDKNGTLWFTQLYSGKIGELNTANGRIREFQPPTISSAPSGITVDNKGTIWFSEGLMDQIGSLDPGTGEFREYSLKGLIKSPRGIAVDKAGKLWVADSGSDVILVMDPVTKKLTRYITSKATYGTISSPYFILISPAGEIWFNERMGNKLGKIDPVSEKMIEIETPYSSTMELPGYVPPPCCSKPTGLPVAPREIYCVALDSQGNLWFTESLGKRIGVVYGDYEPPLVISAPSGVEFPLNNGTTIRIGITSQTSAPADLVLSYNYPENLDGTMVGSLYFNPSEVRAGQKFEIPVKIEPPAGADLENATLTFSAQTGPSVSSALIRLGVAGETSAGPVVKQSLGSGIAIAALTISGFLGVRNRRRRE